ncbi:MAG: helix-turn-helix domain-containing protein [Phycisphaerae bacterium]
MSLGTIIRRKREQLGLTQDQVAARAGISKPYLSNIETGKSKNPPTDGVLQSLERTLSFGNRELLRLANIQRTPADVREQHELLEAEVQKLRSVLKELLSESPRTPAGEIDLEIMASQLGLDENVSTISTGSLVPVINNVPAGYPQVFTDLDYPPSVADEYVRVPDVHDPHAFAARVVGDSMAPKYAEGDIVVFSPETPAESGDDCFIRFAEDEGTTFKRLYVDGEQTLRLQPLNDRYPARTVSKETVTGAWPAVFRMEPIKRR